ncbi:nuclear transport factor 2 family protein [Ulvibacterium marinum]|uniref:nuclear transport factor 2 family protein n=1 Tax=Ulvibacterium marinum TaxID=2419782 RepID=UPI0024943195|nr:nuclear transport factor 2 family protein [Ulvibacterium marinum]
MRKLLLFGLAIITLASCNTKPVRYTQNSPEIDVVKKHMANYNSKNYDTSIYADSSKTFLNTKKNAMTPSEAMEYHKQTDANYSSRGFKAEDQEYEMVVTDDGETWVNCWLDWTGTLAGTGQEIEIPVHLTYRFVEGKVVRELGYWNPTEIVLALQKIEAQKNSSEEEEKL